jgi:hypothetical protein
MVYGVGYVDIDLPTTIHYIPKKIPPDKREGPHNQLHLKIFDRELGDIDLSGALF